MRDEPLNIISNVVFVFVNNIEDDFSRNSVFLTIVNMVQVKENLIEKHWVLIHEYYSDILRIEH